ncbi:MAG TPA: SpoIIE family protein phosphatase [Thermoanaerobaculia bacterium]
MKRYAPYLFCAAGLLALFVLMPYFNAAQPHGVRITRAEALHIADAEAKRLGIPVEKAWSNLTWAGSPLLEKELDKDPEKRRLAGDDPAIGPRLGGYHASYYRRGQEKFTPYGYVYVSGSGELLAARKYVRPEKPGANATEAQLRPRAEAFVHSRPFPGAPSPQFESARPTVGRSRTDWIFRYRVASKFPIGNVVPYLMVYFNGDEFAGWALIEEYADGMPYRGDSGSELAGQFVRFGSIFLLLLVLLIIFLKKYHAGEVGVGTASGVFAAVLFLMIIFDLIIAPAVSEGSNFGNVDAPWTAWAIFGFKMLFLDIPVAVLAFLAWAVGESYARERWGDRLASFDAILHRDPLNATVGRSLLQGVLFAPAVAAAAFAVAIIPLLLHLATQSLGSGSELVLYLGGSFATLVGTLADAIFYPVVIILFMLAFSSRKRALPLGIAAAILFGSVTAVGEVPIDPYLWRTVFGIGSTLALIGVFMAYDLLATSVALFFGSLITCVAPLMSVARGDLLQEMAIVVGVPLGAVVVFAIVALMQKREVVYTYEDLAPHVKRIVERERVKAEIDAANRIQAALLPLDAPSLAGASVASHYRAATEIGGDYFDFLQQPNGEIGIAFGDVSGHGLTSGIVMAMAKSALLVQVGHDASPRAVMNVLNDIVMKTAPRRIMMTFFFGLLDPRSQILRFSSAGHLDPYVYRAATGELHPLSSWGFPLGVRRREPFREHTVEFSAGDRLILYSDGLIEAVDDDGEPYGFERFEHTLRAHGHSSAEEIKKALLTSVRKFTRNRPPEDDQTLVVVSFDEEAASEAIA